MKVIKLKEGHENALKVLTGQMDDASHAFKMASNNSRDARERLWEFALEEYPETAEGTWTYNKNAQQFEQLGKE